MPTYTYRCRKCGHRFDLFHGIKDEKPRRCPKCKSRADRVPAAGAGILFRGSGFYGTDYRSAAYKKKAKQEQAGGSGAGESKGEKTSAKPPPSSGKGDGSSA
jgi:putative FmdB family regulatory protein